MKQLIKYIAALATMLMASAQSYAYYFEVNGIKYSIVYCPGLACQVEEREQKYEGNIIIPSEVVDGSTKLKVVGISTGAFDQCSSLTSVNIPNSVTYIGGCAFRGCTSLTSVTIPNSVTRIEQSVFQTCTSLVSVTIPNSVTEIEWSAFSGCTSLTSVTIPNSVTEIGSCAFGKCSSLKSITIPNSVTRICGEAFWKCSSLTSVTIPNSVTEIGEYAFHGCSSLASVTIPNSVTKIENGTFWECSSLVSVSIPNSITEIGWCAFAICSSLASVTIPNSVKTIGEGAFSRCSSLASVTIPNSVTKIGADAFRNCSSLTSVTIPESTTEIEQYTFRDCASLASVTIPNSVRRIGEGAFRACTSLTSIKLPKAINYIERCAFFKCTSLKSVTAEARSANEKGEGTYIGDSTFNDCKPLVTVSIPGNIGQLWQSHGYDSSIFGGCESLIEIIFLFGEELDVGYGNPYFTSGSWEDWTKQIEKIYIDRSFSEDIPIPNVTELSVGEHVKNLDITYTGKIAKITISATTPPSVIGFTNPEYMTAVVKVPFSALEAYKAHEIWGKFWNLQGFDPAGIDGVEADVAKKSVEGRYDLNGTPVDDDYKGVAIIRFSDGSTKKIMI